MTHTKALEIKDQRYGTLLVVQRAPGGKRFDLILEGNGFSAKHTLDADDLIDLKTWIDEALAAREVAA